jgi:hypothetical protein
MATMKNKKLGGKPGNNDVQKADPIRKKRDVEKNPDKHIDQDFSGYPHAPASEELINPKTKDEKKSAQVNIKDGEKINKHDQQDSDGSANAFEGTETVSDDE